MKSKVHRQVLLTKSHEPLMSERFQLTCSRLVTDRFIHGFQFTPLDATVHQKPPLSHLTVEFTSESKSIFGPFWCIVLFETHCRRRPNDWLLTAFQFMSQLFCPIEKKTLFFPPLC